jgi:hypothetical protein
MKNQNRIEGTFAIVSAHRTFATAQTNRKNHAELVSMALEAGVPLEVLQGQWDGKRELSVRVQGTNAANFARKAAQKFVQDAYITASNGVATLIDIPTGTMTHFKEMVEVQDVTDNYSETMSGFRFRFK